MTLFLKALIAGIEQRQRGHFTMVFEETGVNTKDAEAYKVRYDECKEILNIVRKLEREFRDQ